MGISEHYLELLKLLGLSIGKFKGLSELLTVFSLEKFMGLSVGIIMELSELFMWLTELYEVIRIIDVVIRSFKRVII